MKSISINKYENYQHGAAGINFTSYYVSHTRNQPYEKVLDYTIKQLSDNVKTVINFGCASGRDFKPFEDTYTCIGFDIAPVENINWVCKDENLIYYECSIEDFLFKIDDFKFDWINSLVYTQGTLMYVSHENQNLFVKKIIELGCKNIVIQEYEPGNSGSHPYLNLSQDNLSLFEKKLFRDQHKHNPIAHLYLNK